MKAFRLLLLAGLLAMGLVTAATAAEPATQKSSASNVTVTVTPDVRATDTWSFKVVLDTHSQDLSDDLMKTAVLIDPAGKRYSPTAWEGAGPGGHHREGVLRFAAISPAPEFVQLQITREKETAPRTFRWQLR